MLFQLLYQDQTSGPHTRQQLIVIIKHWGVRRSWEKCSGVTADSYFYCNRVQTECIDLVRAVHILLGSKNNNNNNHIAACRAVIKVFFSFQQFHFKGNSLSFGKSECPQLPGLCRAAGVILEAIHWSQDHRSCPAGWGRCWMSRVSLESWPGDFSGNWQPAATSPVGEVLSWQPALQRHTSDLWPAMPALTWLLTGVAQMALLPEKWVPASVMCFRALRVLGPSMGGWGFEHSPPNLHTAKPYWESIFTTTTGAGTSEGSLLLICVLASGLNITDGVNGSALLKGPICDTHSRGPLGANSCESNLPFTGHIAIQKQKQENQNQK